MKYWIYFLFLLSILTYSSCNSYCPDSIIDVNFTIKTLDYYTREPIKGRSVHFDASPYTISPTTLRSDEKGMINTFNQTIVSSCESPATLNINCDFNDTTFLCTNPGISGLHYSHVQGDFNLLFYYKAKTLPIELKIKHNNTNTSNFALGLITPFPEIKLYSKSILAKNAFDSTFIFKLFPEQYYDYSYSFTDKDGNQQIIKKSILTTLKDTMKIEIAY